MVDSVSINIMSTGGKRRLRNIVEATISLKVGIKPTTAKTLRSDAAAILESVLGELDENAVVAALDNQGLEGNAYRPAIRVLAKIARERRQLRLNPHPPE